MHLHGATNGGMPNDQCSPLRLSLLAEVVCAVGGRMGWRAAVTGLSEPGYNGGDGRGVVMQRWRCPMEVVAGESLGDN